jgi:hypothetical protein
VPDTERKPRLSYPQGNLQGLEVSEVEWSWRRRQEGTGVATEDAAGRREGDTQRRRERDVSARRKHEWSAFRVPAEWGVNMPIFPHCEAQHGVLQCVRLALMAKEHKEAIEIARKVCLHCREQGVEADGTCGRCGSFRTIASEPRLSVALWPRPEWTIVPEAKTNRDFYECVALSEVARDNPGPKRAAVKEISILFDYDQEHTLVYRRWLDDMDVELIPIEPKTVTSSLGRPVETRQIAVIPLQPAKKGGEPVVIGAWVVEESTWSKKKAPAIRNLRDRFISRPTISMTHTARKPAAMDLVVPG